MQLHRECEDPGDRIDLDEGDLRVVICGQTIREHGRLVVDPRGEDPRRRPAVWLSEDYDEEVAHRLHALLGATPSALFTGCDLICVLSAHPPRVGGAACADAGVVLFWRVPRNDDMPALNHGFLDHELGHLAGVDGGPIDPAAWGRAREADAAHGRQVARSVAEDETTDALVIDLAGQQWSLGDVWLNEHIGEREHAEREDWATAIALWTRDRRHGRLEDGTDLRLADLWPHRTRLLTETLTS